MSGAEVIAKKPLCNSDLGAGGSQTCPEPETKEGKEQLKRVFLFVVIFRRVVPTPIESVNRNWARIV